MPAVVVVIWSVDAAVVVVIWSVAGGVAVGVAVSVAVGLAVGVSSLAAWCVGCVVRELVSAFSQLARGWVDAERTASIGDSRSCGDAACKRANDSSPGAAG